MYPFRLKPIYDSTIWAGDELCRIRGVEPHSYGTSWEVSVHPHAQSVIQNGIYAGRQLKDVIAEAPQQVLGTSCTEQDLIRLAFLDARESLSVQVHPGEAYAELHEHDHGKTESWYILDARPGASLVAGCDLATKNELWQAIADGTILKHLRHVPVTRGDFICIPAGMLHALGAGILALEIGTNSNTTYRFYDYDRTDAKGNKRELHLQKSFDVVDLSLRSDASHHPYDHSGRQETLLDRPEFQVRLADVQGEWNLPADPTRYHVLSNMGADAEIRYSGETMKFACTESVFLPAACGEIAVAGNTRVLLSNVTK